MHIIFICPNLPNQAPEKFEKNQQGVAPDPTEDRISIFSIGPQGGPGRPKNDFFPLWGECGAPRDKSWNIYRLAFWFCTTFIRDRFANLDLLDPITDPWMIIPLFWQSPKTLDYTIL